MLSASHSQRGLKISRRLLLAAGGAVAAQTLTKSAFAAGKPYLKERGLDVGLELYTVKEELKADFDGTLKRVADIGYRHVEVSGFYGQTPVKLRAALDRYGLQCRSMHVAAQSTGDGDFPNLMDMPRVIRDAQTLGAKHVILVMAPLPQYQMNGAANMNMQAFLRAVQSLKAEDWKASAALLNDKGKELQRAGLRIGYHNHNFEFSPLEGGTTPFDMLLVRCDPALVTFELDVGWVAAAGVDPVSILKRYPGCFELMHVKDIKASTKTNYAVAMDPADVGGGALRWSKIIPAAYEAGVRNFLIEQEPPFPPSGAMASAANGYRFLSALEV